MNKINEIKISVPEGYEIDKENSTLECIRFKPVQKRRWRDNTKQSVTGFYISAISNIAPFSGKYTKDSYNIFATQKQAKSALAMARISQIMANDERFGGVVTDKEWRNVNLKYAIIRHLNQIETMEVWYTYYFLAFHTEEQRDLFLQENEDLVRDYLML